MLIWNWFQSSEVETQFFNYSVLWTLTNREWKNSRDDYYIKEIFLIIKLNFSCDFATLYRKRQLCLLKSKATNRKIVNLSWKKHFNKLLSQLKKKISRENNQKSKMIFSCWPTSSAGRVNFKCLTLSVLELTYLTHDYRSHFSAFFFIFS